MVDRCSLLESVINIGLSIKIIGLSNPLPREFPFGGTLPHSNLYLSHFPKMSDIFENLLKIFKSKQLFLIFVYKHENVCAPQLLSADKF